MSFQDWGEKRKREQIKIKVLVWLPISTPTSQVEKFRMVMSKTIRKFLPKQRAPILLSKEKFIKKKISSDLRKAHNKTEWQQQSRNCRMIQLSTESHIPLSSLSHPRRMKRIEEEPGCELTSRLAVGRAGRKRSHSAGHSDPVAEDHMADCTGH